MAQGGKEEPQSGWELTLKTVQLLQSRHQLQAAAHSLSAKTQFQSIGCIPLTGTEGMFPSPQLSTAQYQQDRHKNLILHTNPFQPHETCESPTGQEEPVTHSCADQEFHQAEAVTHPHRCLPAPQDGG